MKLGKDFWKVLSILRFIVEFFTAWSKKNNEDTPEGEV